MKGSKEPGMDLKEKLFLLAVIIGGFAVLIAMGNPSLLNRFRKPELGCGDSFLERLYRADTERKGQRTGC
jgi:hypothetical protein